MEHHCCHDDAVAVDDAAEMSEDGCDAADVKWRQLDLEVLVLQ